MSVSASVRQTSAKRRGRSGAERLERRRRIVAWVATLVVVGAVTSFSSSHRPGGYGVPSVPKAVRSPTTPLSSYENGTVVTPNPIDNSSARIVTGNVAGGKHFQDSVPYRPPTSIDAPLGSTSLDSFLRRTTPSRIPGDPAGASNPYCSQTGTVATAASRQGSVSMPDADRPAPNGTPNGSDWPTGATYSDIPMRSLVTPTGDLATGWQTASPSGEPATGEDYDRKVRQLQERLARVKAEVAQLERSLATGKDRSESSAQLPAPGPTPYPDLSSRAHDETQVGQLASASEAARREKLLQETARLLSATMELSDPAMQDGDTARSETAAAAQPRLRLYEMRDNTQTFSGPSSPIDALVSPRTSETVETGARQNLTELPALQRIHETARAFEESGVALNRSATSPVFQASGNQDQRNVDRVPDQTRNTISTQDGVGPSSRSARSSPENDDSPSAKAFAHYLREGQQFMQCRNYRRAAEVFTLASAYRPHNARAHLGKGHALLATGEYLDSALCVGKAVELDLSYVLQKMDLIQLVGGPDAFITHFNELDRRIEAEGGPHLRFLMAYIYYQMDRPQEAKATIDAAQRLLPASIPIDLLRAAIHR